ncbi:hypothetical protein [Methanosarcina mazei]|uniref:Uncharacterized protein n=1 Tax=Methanosarcina mazei TaxID=2209 RepID=A0A0F8IZM9_METMZ|nr:hypothetical protein [Methanosarcina mazei]KKG49231.1 hypothetical protein DU33_16095 [Methanosarcina mazei]KKG62230.1 hypothetical protein DU45_19035 [Methanosarcina mazei]KKG66189.1 hypothetical protein DU64_15330 [Methanosarcina mazei]
MIQKNIYDYFDCSSDFLTIPDSLITFSRDIVFQTWQILERQLNQVDPGRDPEVYRALDSRAAAIFDIWLGFRGRF